MKKYFALEITDFCTRECSHCIVDSTSKGKSLSIGDIEIAIAQIAQLVKSHPDIYRDRIDITGGEALLYSNNGSDFGDVVDVIHRHGLKLKLTTRGWTNAEKVRDALPYRNFMALKSRLTNNNSPIVSISFDLYGFQQKHPALSVEMARNATEGFLAAGCNVTLFCVISRESFANTFAALLDLMAGMEFSVADSSRDLVAMRGNEIFTAISAYCLLKKSAANEDRGASEDQLSHRVISALRQKFDWPLDQPLLIFEGPMGERVPVEFHGFMLAGRGNTLAETQAFPATHCNVPTSSHKLFFVRSDLGVIACCSNNLKHIPAIGSLKQEPMQAVLQRFPAYAAAAKEMQDSIAIEQRAAQNGICSICPAALPTFLNKVSES